MRLIDACFEKWFVVTMSCALASVPACWLLNQHV